MIALQRMTRAGSPIQLYKVNDWLETRSRFVSRVELSVGLVGAQQFITEKVSSSLGLLRECYNIGW